jgi:hypothetical protein
MDHDQNSSSENTALGLFSMPKELSAIIFNNHCAIEDVARCRRVSRTLKNVIEALPDTHWRLRYERDFGGLSEVQRGSEESGWTWRALYQRVASLVVHVKHFNSSKDLDSIPNDLSDEDLEKFALADFIRKLIEEQKNATTEEQQKEFEEILAAKSCYAVFYGHRSLVKALLAHNLLKQDASKKDLLTLALNQGWDDICCMLFKANRYDHKLMKSAFDRTYLHAASEYDDTCHFAELLLQSGADPNIDSEVEQPPLYLAVKNNAINMIKLLLRYGAKATGNPRLMDRPIHFVRSLEVLNMLLNEGAKDSPCVVGRRVTSLLMLLSESPYTLDMFKALLDSNRGYEPVKVLEAAHKNNRQQIIALMEANPEIKKLYDEKQAK